MSDPTESNLEKILVFTIDGLDYAILLNVARRVIHAVEIRHLPKAPDIITGVINVNGEIIPVADIRKILNLQPKEIHPDEKLIIADTGRRIISILVDAVTGITEIDSNKITEAAANIAFTSLLKGVVKTENGLILIYDLEKFLSLDEEAILDRALTDNQE